MIRIICPNPVIDRMYYIDDFREAAKFYEIEPQVYVGGKGVNIARVLSIMETDCELYTIVGGNNGRMIQAEMQAYHVPVHAIEVSGETRTTINIMDPINKRETEITEAGYPVSRLQEQEFLDMLKRDLKQGDIVVCSGIPARGMREDIYKSISHMCSGADCKCILDTTGIYLEHAFPANYYFSKPNISEITELFHGTMEKSSSAMIENGRKMMKMGVKNLLISLGAEGGIFLSGEKAFRTVIPKIEAVSTIGSGDAAVAGFCIGLNKQWPAEDSVKMAMACGISNALNSKVGFVEAGTVQQLFGVIKIEEIGSIFLSGCQQGKKMPS